MFNEVLNAEKLPDRSEKPGEGVKHGICAGLAANSRILAP